MTRRLRYAWLVVLAGAALPAAARAQSGGREFLSGVEFRSLSFDSGLAAKKVSEFVIPVGMVWAVNPRVSLDFGTQLARASSTNPSGASATISGLTDTQARLVYQVRPDVVAFTLSANLPTGTTELSDPQLAVAGVIAEDLIPYPVSSFGTGASVTTGLAVAVPVNGWAIGIGGSYRMSGTYRLATSDSVNSHFKPGAEMRLRVGMDRLVGQGRVSLGLTYSSFANDQFGGQQLAPGNRYIPEASWNAPVAGMNVAVYGWDVYRASGTATASNAPSDEQNLLALGAAGTIQRGRNQWRPMVEYRRDWVSTGGSLAAAGTMLSFGLRYAMVAGERMTLVPGLRFDTGNIVGPAGSGVGYRGLSGSVSVRTSW